MKADKEPIERLKKEKNDRQHSVQGEIHPLGICFLKLQLGCKDLLARAEPEAFFEQRFTPKELFHALSKCRLIPIVVDSEFPKTAAREILFFHFPRLLQGMP